MSNIVCKDLVKIYKTGKIEVVALRDLNLKVNSGEFRAIVGPSGSGKTTLLNLIGGLDSPSAGKIIVNDVDITKLSPKQLIEYRRKSVGFVFQFFNLIPTLTAYENIELPMIFIGTPKEERKKRVKELLTLVGLSNRADHKPHELSGGEQQRVAIAAALANDPPLILADEPTGELDSATGRQIVELFKHLDKELGKTLIIVTHDLRIAMAADKISRIEDGRIVVTLTPAEMEVASVPLTKAEDRLRKLELQKEKINEEIAKLVASFKEGQMDPDEFTKRYSELKVILERIDSEIKRLTLT
ncbi:MAG: ABC transporter ATP-binding protein [Candidatus Njordarchaeia archaeon]